MQMRVGSIALATHTPTAMAQGPTPAAASMLSTRQRHKLRTVGQMDIDSASRLQVRTPTRMQTRLFKAFRDPANASQVLRKGARLFAGSAMVGSHAASANTTELRTVYESANIATGVMATAQGLCFIVVVAGTSSSLCTTTAAASKGGLGLLLHRGREYDVIGVLPEGAKRAEVEEADGTRIETPLDGNDGYAITMEAEPNDMIVTEENGSVYHVGLGARNHAG